MSAYNIAWVGVLLYVWIMFFWTMDPLFIIAFFIAVGVYAYIERGSHD